MPPRAVCTSCGQVYVGWGTMEKCERCEGEVVPYEVDGLDEDDQRVAEKIAAVLEGKSAWT